MLSFVKAESRHMSTAKMDGWQFKEWFEFIFLVFIFCDTLRLPFSFRILIRFWFQYNLFLFVCNSLLFLVFVYTQVAYVPNLIYFKNLRLLLVKIVRIRISFESILECENCCKRKLFKCLTGFYNWIRGKCEMVSCLKW